MFRCPKSKTFQLVIPTVLRMKEDTYLRSLPRKIGLVNGDFLIFLGLKHMFQQHLLVGVFLFNCMVHPGLSNTYCCLFLLDLALHYITLDYITLHT